MSGSRPVEEFHSEDPCIEVSWPSGGYGAPEWVKRLKVRYRRGLCRVYLCGRLVATGCDEDAAAELVRALRRETQGLIEVRYSWAERSARNLAGVVAWHGCRVRLVEARGVDWVDFIYDGFNYGEEFNRAIEACRLGELRKALREGRIRIRPPLYRS